MGSDDRDPISRRESLGVLAGAAGGLSLSGVFAARRIGPTPVRDDVGIIMPMGIGTKFRYIYSKPWADFCAIGPAGTGLVTAVAKWGGASIRYISIGVAVALTEAHCAVAEAYRNHHPTHPGVAVYEVSDEDAPIGDDKLLVQPDKGDSDRIVL